nr:MULTISPECIES: ATP-binding protein [unclassified Synechococcus]
MARRYLSLALAYAFRGLSPPALILLHGLSGSGKSHLAKRLTPWLLAGLHRSDLIRKRLHGLQPLQRPSLQETRQLYGPIADQRTEAALLDAAAASLTRGDWVLLDATHLKSASRERAMQLAGRLGAISLVLDVQADQALLKQRLERRGLLDDDPSDANLPVLQEQMRSAEPLTPGEQECSVVVDSRTDLDDSAVLMALWEHWRARLKTLRRA